MNICCRHALDWPILTWRSVSLLAAPISILALSGVLSLPTCFSLALNVGIAVQIVVVASRVQLWFAANPALLAAIATPNAALELSVGERCRNPLLTAQICWTFLKNTDPSNKY